MDKTKEKRMNEVGNCSLVQLTVNCFIRTRKADIWYNLYAYKSVKQSFFYWHLQTVQLAAVKNPNSLK